MKYRGGRRRRPHLRVDSAAPRLTCNDEAVVRPRGPPSEVMNATDTGHTKRMLFHRIRPFLFLTLFSTAAVAADAPRFRCGIVIDSLRADHSRRTVTAAPPVLKSWPFPVTQRSSPGRTRRRIWTMPYHRGPSDWPVPGRADDEPGRRHAAEGQPTHARNRTHGVWLSLCGLLQHGATGAPNGKHHRLRGLGRLRRNRRDGSH
jgi:hypothetical protein